MPRTRFMVAASTVAALAATSALAARGGDGTVNILYWQAPSIMNPYLSGGAKDWEAASLVLEPLADYDENGKLFPRLARDIPTTANGGISEDFRSITWQLKPGLKWSDGSPVTAADAVFTAKYCMDSQSGCAQLAQFQDVDKVEAPDDLTVKITFKKPMPVPYGPLVTDQSPIIQKKQFANCLGVNAPTCTEANFNPIGTGPFSVVSFKPNDAIELTANLNYRDPDKPHFAKVNLKGGGDALAAARAVLQTGEYDYAWNLLLPPDVLKKMENAGKGKVSAAFGPLVEQLAMNLTDPSPDLPPDERSTAKHANPILGDVRVRKALSMAIDRAAMTTIGFGSMGKPTCDRIPAPENFAAGDKSCLTQDIQGAKSLLDEAGWKPGPDGIRMKGEKRLKLVFQTSTNPVRQQFQTIIKQWWTEIGVDVELKNINSSVFFGSDPGSPDTFQKFYADVEMFLDFFNGNDPGSFVALNTCSNIPGPHNQWQSQNTPRYCDKDYDALVDKLSDTNDYQKRGEVVKKLNAMLTTDSYAYVPLVWRSAVSAVSNSMGGFVANPWGSSLWNAQDWHRVK